jgi:hypothetical protein
VVCLNHGRMDGVDGGGRGLEGGGWVRDAIIMVTSNQDLKSRPPMQRHESYDLA